MNGQLPFVHVCCHSEIIVRTHPGWRDHIPHLEIILVNEVSRLYTEGVAGVHLREKDTVSTQYQDWERPPGLADVLQQR